MQHPHFDPTITSPSPEDALRPDPVFVMLRAIATSGPIGWLRDRFDAWRDDRDERDVQHATFERAMGQTPPVHLPVSLERGDDRSDRAA